MIFENETLLQPGAIKLYAGADAASPTGAVTAQMARLAQSVLRVGGPRLVLMTGAAHAVGTTYIVDRLARTASGLGYRVGSLRIEDVGHLVPDADVRLLNRQPSAGDRLRAILHDRCFDLLLLDAPPVAESALAMTMAPMTDGVVLVVNRNHTLQREILAGLETLSVCRTACLGLVLNTAPRRGFF